MKLNKFFMLGLVGLAFTACSNDEDGAADVQQDTALKTVKISLANVKQGTRTPGAPVEDGTTAQLNTFQIFFVDGAGNFHNGYAADATDPENRVAAETYFDLTEEGGGDILETKTFHYVDASVTKVIVVANHAKLSPTNEAALWSEKVNIADQQDVTKLVMVGFSTLTEKTEDHSAIDGHTQTKVYEANVQIEPLVARLEVGAFRYNPYVSEDAEEGTEGTRKYTSLSLTKLAFNNYYGTSTLNAVVDDKAKFFDVNTSTVWSFLASRTSGWDTDILTSVELSADNEYEYGDENGEASVFAYNFFPNGTDGQIVLSLTGILANSSEDALYLATSGFGTSFSRGYVYRMTLEENSDGSDSPFEFDDDDFENPDKCVEVTVSRKVWTVVTVTPEF